jgi:hypothetical protein
MTTMKKVFLLFIITTIAVTALCAQDAPKKSAAAAPAKRTHTKTSMPTSGEVAAASAKSSGVKKNAFTPGEMQWGDGPPFIQAGAKMAVLDGNPMGDEVYTLRLKLPDGYKVAPHWHPKREEVTVISGTLNVGMGDKFDAAKMKPFPAGSFAYLDPDMHHYVQTKGATELQIHGRGPVKFNYIDPKDDPSAKK